RTFAGIALYSALVACSSGPAPAPAPLPGPPPPPLDDGVEIATEGNSTITVLNRPDHPSVKPPPGANPTPRTTAECRMEQTCATQGLCTSNGTTCVAESYEDCAQMRACATGKCLFVEG